jgi:hypothetical protein
MNKPTLVFQGPIFTRSGYGDHCRDLMKSLRKMDKYDIKIIPLRWGNTPQNQVSDDDDFGRWMLERVIGEIGDKPDVFMQVSVANEFEPKGHYNIGITAGVETTIAPKDFIDGSNKMNLIIVPSVLLEYKIPVLELITSSPTSIWLSAGAAFVVISLFNFLKNSSPPTHSNIHFLSTILVAGLNEK